MPTFTRTVVGVVALGLAACGAETAVEPTEYDDVAQMLASSLQSDVGGGLHGALDDAWSLAQGTLPAGFTVDRFGWASGRHGDATYKYQVTCDDAAGHRLSACDATTDRATVIAAWHGVGHVIAYDYRFDREALWEFEHLQSGAATITGVSHLGADATFGVIGKPAAYTLATVFDERYLLDTVAHELFGADLTGELAVDRNGERFAIDALIELDRDTTTAAIRLDDQLVLQANLDTSFPGE
jgi:hypothetical protein